MSAPSRRRFLRTTAAGAAAVAAPAHVRALGGNDRVRVALVGSGGRGLAHLRSLDAEAKGETEVVALCDVDAGAIDRVRSQFPATANAKAYADFRRLFDEAQGFDAVFVSTCEHTHALATLMALTRGKHVYCEKPLTHNVWEARVIREAAAATKLATQMGNQNHSNPNYRRVVELIQSGAIGAVREAHTWVSRAWGLQSEAEALAAKDRAVTPDSPQGTDPVPPGLDWDLWIGPAPMRPFNNAYVPGPKWYRYWDFGNGTMSDLGSHSLDLPFWALKLKAPRTVEAFGPPPHRDIAPATMKVVYEYDARGDLPPVRLTWYQGNVKPDIWRTDPAVGAFKDGTCFIGEKGMLVAHYRGLTLLPEDRFADFQGPEQFIPDSPGHWAQFIQACKTGAPTGSNFEYAGWLTEAKHLGNVAYRTGKRIEWDAAALEATNAPEAARFIRKEYRAGWEV